MVKTDSWKDRNFLKPKIMIKADNIQKAKIAMFVKGDKELKKNLVQQAAGNPKITSTKDLTHAQANALLQSLGMKPVVYDNWAFFNPLKQSHKQILSLCIQYGWSVPNGVHGEVADLGKLSEWLKSKKAPVNKRLKNMSALEVSKTISALESMVTKKYK